MAWKKMAGMKVAPRFFQEMHGIYTPPKFNMEPENQPMEKEIPFGNPSFSGSMLNFGGVYVYYLCLKVFFLNPHVFWLFLREFL